MSWARERATSDPLLRLSIPCDIVITDGHGMGPREGVGDLALLGDMCTTDSRQIGDQSKYRVTDKLGHAHRMDTFINRYGTYPATCTLWNKYIQHHKKVYTPPQNTKQQAVVAPQIIIIIIPCTITMSYAHEE